VVEPRLSIQWFVRTEPLAERAMASVRNGRTRIIPPHFEKVYAHWMENIHDWAVGRQLWWGHRIPAWYCPDGHITVSDAEEGPDACATCGRPATELTQETDIFDTWFSSGLWPFSTLGWPDDTPDYRRFYPTSVMETGYDILFFWVARMMMLGLFLTDGEPFHTVFLHGIVRGEGGVKMSKTKGNVVDPLEVVEEFGADALRFALTASTSPGSDQRLTEAKIAGARNFTNKLWNAARFVIGARPDPLAAPAGELGLPERWIASRLADATARATRQLDDLDPAGYAGGLHDFAWSDYCDWFLEMAKLELRRDGASDGERARVWWTAARTLAGTLRLLHPIVPFATEEIWTRLHALDPALTDGEPLLISAHWPQPGERDALADAQVADLIELVRSVRNLRSGAGLPAGEWIPLAVAPADDATARGLETALRFLEPMARVRPITLRSGETAPSGAPATTGGLGVAWLERAEAATERDGSGREAYLREGIRRLEALLGDARFVERAPPTVVERERARLEELRIQLASLTGNDA
jgi:valyl-tRNA synthetase